MNTVTLISDEGLKHKGIKAVQVCCDNCGTTFMANFYNFQANGNARCPTKCYNADKPPVGASNKETRALRKVWREQRAAEQREAEALSRYALSTQHPDEWPEDFVPMSEDEVAQFEDDYGHMLP